MKLIEGIQKLPKTDLHCHLDGSLRAETILEIARKEKVDIGATDLSSLRKKLVCGEKVSNLEIFLQAFDITCAVLQSKEAIERIAFELSEDAAAENVRYLEVRFSPVLATQKGLSMADVMKAARRGLVRSEKKYPIRTGLIVCALRNLEPKVSVQLAQLAADLRNDGVVGFDLAHAETGNPAGKHAEAFAIAKKAGLGLTVHAGESFGPDSIRQALDDCFARRIGHGRTLPEDSELEQRVIQEEIAVECCPSSNVQISLTPTFGAHPLKGMLERGVRVTLNTDNRLLTNIRVTDEYLRAGDDLGLSWDQLCTIARNGFRSAFLPETERTSLIEDTEKEIVAITIER